MIARALAWITIAAVLAAAPARAQTYQNGALATNAMQTCGPTTGTLTNVGDTVFLNCPGAQSYLIQVATNGATALAGTITSTDSLTGGGRLLFKTGVGELDVATLPMTGNQVGTMEYRTVGGGYGQRITLTAVTAGSATVTILGTFAPSVVFVNSAVHTADEAAMRAGRAFTASTGLRNFAVSSNLELMLSNPTGSGKRLVIPAYYRVVGCNNVFSALLPAYSSLTNPTTNLPSTAATVSRRGGGGATAPVATAVADVLTTTPQTTPPTSFPLGIPFAGAYAIPQERTLEPGQSQLIYITGVAVPSGLGSTTPTCSILLSWYEEDIN